MIHIKNKKVLYFGMTFLLNVIEVYRNDTSFDLWSIATNLTGLVVLGCIISQMEIKKLLCRSTAIISVIAIVSATMAENMKNLCVAGTTSGQIRSAIFNIWWILIVALYKAKDIIVLVKERSIIRKDTISFGLWTVASIWGLLSRSDSIWPIWFWCMFSLFYLTSFSEDDWKELWNSIITGTIWFFVYMQVVHMPFRPYDMVRYSGFMVNPNDFAKYLAIVYLFILVKINILHSNHGKIVFKSIYILIAGVNLAMTFMTGCRTVWLIDLIVSFIYAIFVVRGKWGTKIWKVCLGIFASGALVISLIYPSYLVIRYIPTIHPHPIWFYGEYHGGKVFSWDPADSEKYVSFQEMLDTNLGRLSEMLFTFLERIPGGIQAEAKEIGYIDSDYAIKGLPDSISIRIRIAEEYLSKCKMLGNNSSDVEFYYVPEEGEMRYIWHSQNLWVQITFMFGIPFGILMFAVFILRFITSVRVFSTEDRYGINILPLMYMVLYFIYGLMEVTWLPGYMILTMVFMVQHPQFQKTVSPCSLVEERETHAAQ